MSAENSPSANPSSNSNKVYLALGGCGLLLAGLALGFALDRPSPPPFHQPPHVRAGFPNPEKPGHKMDRKSRGEEEMGRRHALQGERREQRGEIREEMQKWAEPMGKIREKYRGEIAKVLRPEQKAKMESSLENHREGREQRRDPRPGNLMEVVLIAPQLDRLTQHLVLDDAQKKQVETVLKKQREEILAWLDANPAPKPPGRPNRALGHWNPGMAEGLAAHRPFPPGPPQRP